jgi:hypothetical protein
METQTIYAELLEHLRVADFARSFADLAGGVMTRERGGEKYWYFRTHEGLGTNAQEFYIGQDDEPTRRLIQTYKDGRENAQANTARIARLSAMLRSGGLTLTDFASTKIIKAFANTGVFRLGGVLVGTHAFVSIGNSLGVKWPSSLHTQDVDFGALANRRVGIGVLQNPQLLAHVPKAIEALEMGFIPNIRIHVASKPTSYVVPGKEWRIDIVTAPHGGDREAPVEIPRLGAWAQPLEFMDYLLGKTMDAAIVGSTAILVQVPEPARFAVHKLLVASNRDKHSALIKAAKDRQQAFHVMTFLEQERPGDIMLAAEDALQRGPSWRRRIQQQADLMPGRIQELDELIR